MAFIAKTFHKGQLIARFAPNYTSDNSVTFNIGMPAESTLLLVPNIGTDIRRVKTNGAGIGVTFPAGSAIKYVDVYNYGGPTGPSNNARTQVTTIVAPTFVSQIGNIPNVIDLTIFPNLNSQVNLSGSHNYTKVKADMYSPILLRFRNLGLPLDLSECFATGVNFRQSGPSSLVLPAANSRILQFLGVEHRISSQNLIFPAWSNCNTIDLNNGSGQSSATAGDVDISQLTFLGSLNLSHIGFKNLLSIGSNNFTNFSSLNLSQNWLTTRIASWGGATTLSNLTALLGRAMNLTSISLSYCGFSEAELDSIINTIESTKVTGTNFLSRVSTAKNLNLYDDDQPGLYGYPLGFNNNPSGPYQYGFNASIVTQATRNIITNLVSNYNWTISYNRNVFGTASYLNGGMTVRYTYGGAVDPNLWSVNSYVTLLCTSGFVPSGTYLVTGGSGKVWDLLGMKPVTLAFGTTSGVAIDATAAPTMTTTTWTSSMLQATPISIPNVASLMGKSTHTLEFWMVPTGTTGIAYEAVGGASQYNRYSAHIPFSGTIYYDSGNIDASQGRTTWNPPAGFWGTAHHFAFQTDFENNVRKIYVDGVQMVSVAGLGSYTFFSNDILRLLFSQGAMGEVRYWTIARTVAEINATKDVSLQQGRPGLLMSIRGDERGVAGTAVLDRSGNGYNGVTY